MDYSSQFENLQKKTLEIFLKKNKDYGNAFEKYGTVGVLIRINDKISRLVNISKNQITLVEDESLRDTLLDLSNYSLLAAILNDEKK